MLEFFLIEREDSELFIYAFPASQFHGFAFFIEKFPLEGQGSVVEHKIPARDIVDC